MQFTHLFIQAATTIDEDGNGIQVLFDVMSHTLDAYVIFHSPTLWNGLKKKNICRSSGVGDHGMAGIDTFLEKHECVERCKQLRLQRSGFATEPTLDDSDDDEV